MKIWQNQSLEKFWNEYHTIIAYLSYYNGMKSIRIRFFFWSQFSSALVLNMEINSVNFDTFHVVYTVGNELHGEIF